MKRYFALTGKLICRTAIHLGSGQGNDVTDALCRRDLKGRFIIPGTTLAGNLRTLATRIAPRMFGQKGECKALQQRDDGKICDCQVCKLFGNRNPSDDENSDEPKAYASRIIVSHAIANLADGKMPRIRDGVGITRSSRTAAKEGSVKFDYEVLPSRTTFDLRIELEATDNQDEMLLVATLAEWQAGRVWLGASKSRGLGAITLSDIKIVEHDFTDTDVLMNFLKTDTPWQGMENHNDWFDNRLQDARVEIKRNSLQTINTQAQQDHLIVSSFVTLQCTLQIDGPFLSNDPMAAMWSEFSHAPVLDVINRSGKAILPGASLRGALRSQAERIARTIVTLDVSNENEYNTRCPACDPVQSLKDAALANCDTLIRQIKTIKEHDEIDEEYLCLSCRLFGSTRRGSRLIVEDAVDTSKESIKKILDFLAIDRFTGGGKHGAKFDALTVWNPQFDIQIHLENPHDWELGWLLFVLRDLADGMVPLGYGAAKGFGQVKMTTRTINYYFIDESDFIGESVLKAKSPTASNGIYREIRWQLSECENNPKLIDLENKWACAFRERVVKFTRRSDMCQVKDTFFSGVLPDLYKKGAYKCLPS